MWYRSSRQTTVATSTAEAELAALAETAKEIMFQRNILREVNILKAGPTPIFCDNAAATTIASGQFSSKTRHVRVCYSALTQWATNHIISPILVDSSKQRADILTKPLSYQTLTAMIKLMGME